VKALQAGGNAIDAAAACALTLGAVDGTNSGIGGGCFLLIRTADGSIFAIDGRETAPAAATREMFVKDGKGDTELSQTGTLASGVPGELAAYDLAVRRWGKLSLKAPLLAAADIAEKGFVVEQSYAGRIESVAKDLARFPSSRAIFLKPDGAPWRKGDRLVQADLAKTYRAIAAEGENWFYDGPFAEATAEWMKANGGILTAEDFKNYRVKLREPVRSTYRGCEVVSFPPPSSGGILVLQLLNIAETFDLATMGRNSASEVHMLSEAMNLAFADRAYWLGDPDFTTIPSGLFSKEYAKKRAALIDPKQALKGVTHGEPSGNSPRNLEKHTTHFCTADAQGNWVACTATINTTFGSKVVTPGTGVMLNNEMDDFSVQPGVPNAFGLVGGDANAVGPNKRPLSSMGPTIVLEDGKPILAIGAAGGPTIITQTVLGIINTLDYRLPVDEALASPRFHHQWNPDALRIEPGFAPSVLNELRQEGHPVLEVPKFGACQAIGWNEKSGEFVGSADPRNGGTAAGY
jgi:gamma-glutamyltranspeptidase/glutathione hydrolase